jgi:hypothetical protein
VICMKCEHCGGRWVALTFGATIASDRVSYHFDLDALACPRCGKQGVADEQVIAQHQRHPQVVATKLRAVE